MVSVVSIASVVSVVSVVRVVSMVSMVSMVSVVSVHSTLNMHAYSCPQRRSQGDLAALILTVLTMLTVCLPHLYAHCAPCTHHAPYAHYAHCAPYAHYAHCTCRTASSLAGLKFASTHRISLCPFSSPAAGLYTLY